MGKGRNARKRRAQQNADAAVVGNGGDGSAARASARGNGAERGAASRTSGGGNTMAGSRGASAFGYGTWFCHEHGRTVPWNGECWGCSPCGGGSDAGSSTRRGGAPASAGSGRGGGARSCGGSLASLTGPKPVQSDEQKAVDKEIAACDARIAALDGFMALLDDVDKPPMAAVRSTMVAARDAARLRRQAMVSPAERQKVVQLQLAEVTQKLEANQAKAELLQGQLDEVRGFVETQSARAAKLRSELTQLASTQLVALVDQDDGSELLVEGVDANVVKRVLDAQAVCRRTRMRAAPEGTASGVQLPVAELSASAIHTTLRASLADIPADDPTKAMRTSAVIQDWKDAKDALSGGKGDGKGSGARGGFDPMGSFAA